jgi:Uma2 family endonuclease
VLCRTNPAVALTGCRRWSRIRPPAGFEELLERRRRLGQDRFDEVWEGVLHVNPAPSYEHQRLSQRLAVILDPLASAAGLEAVVGGVNLGDPRDYRIPDGSLHRPGSGGTYLPSAELVVEIVPPDDDTWKKLAVYAAHQVDELLIVDPEKRRVDWLGLEPGGEYRAIERSRLIEFGSAELAQSLDWPPAAA